SANIVRFAARNADTRPYAWRDDVVPTGHPVRQLAPHGSFRDRSWWPQPNGEPAEYWVDARRGDKRTVAVFAVQNWWGIPGLSTLDRDDDDWEGRRPVSRRFRCRSCRAERSTWGFDCSDCTAPFCATCGRCNCERAADDGTELC